MYWIRGGLFSTTTSTDLAGGHEMLFPFAYVWQIVLL
jgi:hypothetical protein